MRQVEDGTGALRHLGGWRRDLPRLGDSVVIIPSSVALPPKADLPLMSKVPVYDQGQLGSCTANMGCAMFRYLCVHAGLPPLNVSRMSLYKSTRMIEGTPLSVDSGAQIRSVMFALRKYGVALEADDPYVDDGHQFTLAPTSVAVADAEGHQALFYYRLVDLHTIKASIVQGFPVGFGFSVYENMMSQTAASTGLVYYPEPGEKSDGGHAVTCIGYDDGKVIGRETGALLIRNSWGDGWGQGGSFWLPFSYVTSGLAADFWSLRSVAL